MTEAAEREVSDVQRGWAELAHAKWEAAATAFLAALAVKESASALEGLSWAAWWLDRRDEVFDARQRAHRLYKQSGDSASAARMAIWLACDYLDFDGAFAAVNGWLARARRLLGGLQAGPEHGWLAFFEGYVALGAGDATGAIEHGRAAAASGRVNGVVDLEILGLALEGAAQVTLGEVEDGMRCLDEATAGALAGEVMVPISSAWTCCFLVTSCATLRDYERAVEWCDRIAEFAERFGSRYMLAFCRAEYGSIALWRGHWDEAERLLVASIDDFARARPAFIGGPLLALAELRCRQGRWSEAGQLLDRAGPSPMAQLVQGRMALDQGDAPRAINLAERALRHIAAESSTDRVPAIELLVRARIARGQFAEAEAALTQLAEIAKRVRTDALLASRDQLRGTIEAARGAHAEARAHFEDATDAFERCGGVFEAAQCRVELGISLIALGSVEAAEVEIQSAIGRFERLGAATQADRARRLGAQDKLPTALDILTPREREVVELVAKGLSNRELAQRLVISEHTAHRHVSSILTKLELPSRAAVAAWAARSGARVIGEG